MSRSLWAWVGVIVGEGVMSGEEGGVAEAGRFMLALKGEPG